jgi:hypothetical protein
MLDFIGRSSGATRGAFPGHKKEFGLYHWDTFDNRTILVGEAKTLQEAIRKVKEKYKDRLKPDGADRVEIVNRLGSVVKKYNVG